MLNESSNLVGIQFTYQDWGYSESIVTIEKQTSTDVFYTWNCGKEKHDGFSLTKNAISLLNDGTWKICNHINNSYAIC